MTFAEFIQLVQDGGWLLFVIYFLYREVWPLIAQKLIPGWFKRNESEREERVRLAKAEAAERVRLADEERKFRERIEVERLESAKRTQEAIVALSIAMTQTNERIAAILQNQNLILQRQDATYGALTEGIGDMRARTGTLRRVDESAEPPNPEDPIDGED